MLKWLTGDRYFREVLNMARYRDRVAEAARAGLRRLPAGDWDQLLADRIEEGGFCYDPEASPLVCQGPGRPVHRAVSQEGGQGRAGGAGSRPGKERREMPLTLAEPAEVLLADLMPLPFPDEQDQGELVYRGHGSCGMMSLLDRKATFLARLKRQALGAGNRGAELCRHDLRFRVWEPEERDRGRALLVAVMDNSASMSSLEHKLAGHFFYWLVQALKRRYHRLDTVYISHDFVAEEVPQEAFFAWKGDGGTRFSAAYRLAWQIITGRYAGVTCPKYVVHCTDGGNLPTDREEAVFWLVKLLECCRLVGYGEIRTGEREPLLPAVRKPVEHPALVAVGFRNEEELYAALKALLGRK